MLIKSFTEDSALHILWQSGEVTEYSFFWLRDNARDPASFDSRSHQRLVHTATIPPDIKPVNTRCSADGSTLRIEWSDGESCSYNAAFLFRYRTADSPLTRHPPPVLWRGQTETDQISFNRLRADNELALALAHKGFALITDCPCTSESVALIAGELGYVRNSIFGDIWVFEDDQLMDDSAYSSDALRPHTDGTYCLDPPGVQILLCLEKKGEGGASVLVDGFSVAAEIRQQNPADYKTLSTLKVEALYHGDGAILKARHPIFREEHGQLRQVCFNNYDRDVMQMDRVQMDALYRGIRTVDAMFNDPDRQWRHTLQPGQALVFDNWRILHGRTGYSGRRKMTGAYVNREDLDSRLRILSAEN